jgi:hypothetical protein
MVPQRSLIFGKCKVFSIIVANTVKMNGSAAITFNIEVDEADLEPPEELYYCMIEVRISK